jgi:hypothetical protein
MVTGFDGFGAAAVAVPAEVCDGGAVSVESLDRCVDEAAAEVVPGASASLGSCPEPRVQPTRRASDANPTRARATARVDGLTRSTLERTDHRRRTGEAHRADAG